MAGVVVVYVKGATPDRAVHRKVSIANRFQALTFPIISPESELSDLAATWAEQPRPGRKPLLRRAGLRLAKHSITVTLVRPDPQASVESDIRALAMMAQSTEPIALAYGASLPTLSASGHWVIRDLTIRVLARAQGTNDATQAEATIDLLEANIPRWKRPASMKKPAASTTTKLLFPVASGSPLGTEPIFWTRPRAHTVVAGEGLYGIALRYYDDVDMWRAVADANGIIDPRTVEAGQVLRLP